MKRKFSFISLLAISLSLYSQDYEGPKVESFTFSPESIDITNSSQTVTVTAHVTDESGVKSAPLVYIQLSGKETATQQTGYFALTSGDAKDGIYTTSIIIPKGKEGGEWSIFSNGFYDINNYLSKSTHYPTSEKKTLTVINSESSGLIFIPNRLLD